MTAWNPLSLDMGRKCRSSFLFVSVNMLCMIERTIVCKLFNSKEINDVLSQTSIVFANACNYALEIAKKENVSNKIKLQKICYYDIRKVFYLSSNLTIGAIRRASSSLTKLKKRRKAPRKFLPKSIDYDARTFSFIEKDRSVSIKTFDKRIRIPLVLSDYQRSQLTGQNPTHAKIVKKGNDWYIHIGIKRDVSKKSTSTKPMGIDAGIKNTAYTSEKLAFSGETISEYKAKRNKIRASLQSKGTRGAKRVLKRLSGKEKRFTRHTNHVISKKLVADAKRHDCGIVRMERLKDIRAKTKTWNKHRNRMTANWSYYQLQQFVDYKSAEVGLTFELIDPFLTSQTCHVCSQLGSRNGEQFKCLTCGDMHADYNAACNIASGGVRLNTPELAANAS